MTTTKTLKSYVYGTWHEAPEGARWAELTNPSTGETIARASTEGVDFERVLEHARTVGGPALRALTFAERGAVLKEMSKALRGARDTLFDLSRENTGTTRWDAAFDIDGATGTLAYYAGLAKGLGDARVLPEGDGAQMAKTDGFWGQHVLVPKRGVAVCINAFNFPVWGFAEKVACAFLAGVPVVVKPATATAMVTERAVRVLVEAEVLPEGSFQLVTGSSGDLLDHLGSQDVLAFTGSAATANKLRGAANLLEASVRVNVEADSLNAAVLGPDAIEAGGETLDLFVRDVVREITQKAGQKCTAVRRILVPADRLDQARDLLVAKLEAVEVGDPADDGVAMGPVATRQQLDDTLAGIEQLRSVAEVATGGAPVDRQGFFLQPTLFVCRDARGAGVVHEREVFAPVATMLPYDGTAADAAEIVALGGGTLVTSVYSDDTAWVAEFLADAAATTGRIYLGSEGSAEVAPGSGAAFPVTLHGGPGRAGGGEELGGLVGVKAYMQRVALQGARPMVDQLAGIAD
jgi:oxepin-CoA hydrolase/3-oxo-5,6-dehydrosuberyl-CoA semialdehyde dehydrogenase